MWFLSECNSVEEIVRNLKVVIKKAGHIPKDFRIEDHRLCYSYIETGLAEQREKEKDKALREKYWQNIERTGSIIEYWWKDYHVHVFKVNLCKYIDPWKEKRHEWAKKHLKEEWEYPSRWK